MRKLAVFSYLVLFHPDPETNVPETQRKTGKDEMFPVETLIVVPMGTLLATDERTANMKVLKKIDEKYLEHAERLEVAVRPF